LGGPERPQEQRLPGAVKGDHDEGSDAAARADMPVPRREQIETLVGGANGPALEGAPKRLGARHGIAHLNAGDRGCGSRICEHERLAAGRAGVGDAQRRVRSRTRQHRYASCRAHGAIGGLLGCHCTIL